MKKLLLPSLLLASYSLYADQITGVVKDENNQPIAKAKIELHGKHGVVYTDKDGKFSISSDAVKGPLELHVSAKGFKHVTLHDSVAKNLSVTLTPSVLEYLDVYGTPLHASMLESATPITVLSDEDLKYSHAATLGETLKSQVGIQSTYYGPSASSPIIRGLDGPRVMVAQNGLDVGDASRVGPDHVVSTDTATVKQVEILRGPATLIFGNGAIGGVVNVVDNRVPTSSDFEADWSLSHNTVADENEASVNLTTGTESFAFHFDAFKRDGDDYEIPANPEMGIHEGETEEEHEEHEAEFNGKLENSSSESDGFNVGASYLMDSGYVGVSFGKLNKLYGITGHSHDHGHEEEGHEDEHGEEEHGEESVMGDMKQDRVQIISEFNLDNKWLSAIKSRYGYTDYQHSEIEGGAVGTTFTNESHQFKTDLLFKEVDGWHGAVTLDYRNSDFSAVGEEAFTPPSETDSFAVALLEEKHFGDVLLQLGVRAESVELTAKELFVTGEHHEEEGHEEEHHDEHEDEHHDEMMGFSKTFHPISLSAGLVWDFAEGQNIGVSFSHSERAPSAAEVLSFGPHIGTNSFEVGALYAVHQEGDEYHFDMVEQDLKMETSNNIDISYRKFDGDFGVIFNVFYNRINDFYYQSNTGLFREDGHDHGHEDEHHDEDMHEEEGHEEEGHEEHHDEDMHEEEGGLPVFITQARDAELYGFEAQFVWQLNSAYRLKLQSDYIRGKLVDGGNLPRISPARFGATLDYTGNSWDGKVEVMHNFKQDDITQYETDTDSYTMVNLAASYYFNVGEQDLTAFFKANNLTDEEARVHTSYLKSTTLLPGRGFTVGIRGSF